MSPLPSARERAWIRRALGAWYRKNRRDLPWRRTRDPYAIWVSEAMLQQTRVAAVIPYYERFLAEFPDLASLAAAPEERVLARWSGLGYYRRARHLRAAALLAMDRHGGALPREPGAFGALPGVGRYTTGAVLSIAYGVRLPVVDGNVERVLSRVFARRAKRDTFWDLAAALMPLRAPGDFNQAMMELGATVCTPRAPRCDACPLAARCRGKDRPDEFPVRATRAPVRRVRAAAAILESARGVYLVRVSAGPNRGLFDPPTASGESSLRRRLAALGFRVSAWRERGVVRHGILDRAYHVTVYHGRVAGRPAGEWLTRRGLRDAPLTARARKALELARKA